MSGRSPDAANENELKLVVVTVALRIEANKRVDSIYGIDTKNEYFGDIEAYEVMEVPYA